jgi:hypothetical protein
MFIRHYIFSARALFASRIGFPLRDHADTPHDHAGFFGIYGNKVGVAIASFAWFHPID